MQMDLFDDTLCKKINRMEKWMDKIHTQMGLFRQEMMLVKGAHYMSKKCEKIDMFTKQLTQSDMFEVG